jgi:hypothetical protein
MDGLVKTWKERSDFYLQKAREAKDETLQGFYSGSAITLKECAEELQRDYERKEKE